VSHQEPEAGVLSTTGRRDRDLLPPKGSDAVDARGVPGHQLKGVRIQLRDQSGRGSRWNVGLHGCQIHLSAVEKLHVLARPRRLQDGDLHVGRVPGNDFGDG
jgi:hypothetical protein